MNDILCLTILYVHPTTLLPFFINRHIDFRLKFTYNAVNFQLRLSYFNSLFNNFPNINLMGAHVLIDNTSIIQVPVNHIKYLILRKKSQINVDLDKWNLEKYCNLKYIESYDLFSDFFLKIPFLKHLKNIEFTFTKCSIIGSKFAKKHSDFMFEFFGDTDFMKMHYFVTNINCLDTIDLSNYQIHEINISDKTDNKGFETLGRIRYAKIVQNELNNNEFKNFFETLGYSRTFQMVSNIMQNVCDPIKFNDIVVTSCKKVYLNDFDGIMVYDILNKVIKILMKK